MKTTINIEKWNATSELAGKFGCLGKLDHAKEIIPAKGTYGKDDYEPSYCKLLLFDNQDQAIEYAQINGYHTVIHYEKAD